jgi:exonuclease III
MRIVSWNCGGALGNKFQSLTALNADICVVQECEDPARTNNVPFREWATNYLWVGDNKNRGLGVFARPGVAIEPAPLDPGQLQSFLPCLLKQSILLVGVWTRRSTSYDYRYIGQLWQYIQLHRASLAQATLIVIGDLNSNVIWDSRHAVVSHSKVVSALQELGLESTYHAVLGVPQGKEQDPTFYLQRKLSKPYHIDYAFVPRDWIGSCTIQVGKAPEWIKLSDHMPVTVEIGDVT